MQRTRSLELIRDEPPGSPGVHPALTDSLQVALHAASSNPTGIGAVTNARRPACTNRESHGAPQARLAILFLKKGTQSKATAKILKKALRAERRQAGTQARTCGHVIIRHTLLAGRRRQTQTHRCSRSGGSVRLIVNAKTKTQEVIADARH